MHNQGLMRQLPELERDMASRLASIDQFEPIVWGHLRILEDASRSGFQAVAAVEGLEAVEDAVTAASHFAVSTIYVERIKSRVFGLRQELGLDDMIDRSIRRRRDSEPAQTALNDALCFLLPREMELDWIGQANMATVLDQVAMILRANASRAMEQGTGVEPPKNAE